MMITMIDDDQDQDHDADDDHDDHNPVADKKKARPELPAPFLRVSSYRNGEYFTRFKNRCQHLTHSACNFS